MPPLSLILRASLVPFGLALAGRGLQDLGDEADRRRAELAELAALTEAHRRYLNGDGPAPEPEDFPPAAELEDADAGNPPVPRRSRFGVIALGLLGVAIGYGAVSGYRAAGRDRAQLAAAVGAARSSVRLAQPPAPGSPADLFAARDPYDTVARLKLRDDDDQADDDQGDEPDADRPPAKDYMCRWCLYREQPRGGDLLDGGGDMVDRRALRLTLHERDCHDRPAAYAVRA